MDTAIDLGFLAIWQYLLMAPALTLLAPKIKLLTLVHESSVSLKRSRDLVCMDH